MKTDKFFNIGAAVYEEIEPQHFGANKIIALANSNDMAEQIAAAMNLAIAITEPFNDEPSPPFRGVAEPMTQSDFYQNKGAA